MTSKKTPHHVEAGELGVGTFGAIKSLSSQSTASEIKAVWDYRKAGLTVDQAREYIRKWNRHLFWPRHTVRDYNDLSTLPGRITRISNTVDRIWEIYVGKMADIKNMPLDGQMSWDHPKMKWMVGERTIITIRHESVTWGTRKNPRYPESSSVTYTSHLIRETEPGTMELSRANEYQMLDTMTEKKVSHDLRGKWQTRVVKELLGVDFSPEQAPQVFFKKVAVAPNGTLASVYDGSEYRIGETRKEKVIKNHNGGLYCYKTREEAEEARFPGESVFADAPKKIIAVEVKGEKIMYDNGKYAVSEMTPLEVIA